MLSNWYHSYNSASFLFCGSRTEKLPLFICSNPNHFRYALHVTSTFLTIVRTLQTNPEMRSLLHLSFYTPFIHPFLQHFKSFLQFSILISSKIDFKIFSLSFRSARCNWDIGYQTIASFMNDCT